MNDDSKDRVYLFSVNAATPPMMTVDPGDEVTLEVRGAFADVTDIRNVPTPFTPACDGHPLAPIAGPIEIRGAEVGDAVTVHLLEITPHELVDQAAVVHKILEEECAGESHQGKP